jgi:site-specific recombinase XerD
MPGLSGAAGTRRRDDGSVRQAPLFDPDPADAPPAPPPAPLIEAPPPTRDSTIGASRLAYERHLRRAERSRNTVTCFLSDLGLLVSALGAERPLRSIALKDLREWERGIVEAAREQGREVAPKTLARHRTFLRNFFAWLVAEGALDRDPSADLPLMRPAPPLPVLLFEDEVLRLEAASADDLRCRLLVMLLLETGLKKEELLALRARDVDLSDPERPAVEVHFPGRDRRRRERRMALPAAWTELYRRYLERYRPAERVFECTGRNLAYLLTGAARRAGLERRVADGAITMQRLRDVYAVRQLRAGVGLEALREKLGLSEEAWQESAEKYRKLAFPA